MNGRGIYRRIPLFLLILEISSVLIFTPNVGVSLGPQAFAQQDNGTYEGPIPENNGTIDNNPIDVGNGPIPEDNSTTSTEVQPSAQENMTQGNLGENTPQNPEQLAENYPSLSNETSTGENMTLSQTLTSPVGSANETVGTLQENQTSQEIENEINNEKATHHQTQQEASDIVKAETNHTIAAEVDIGVSNVTQKSIDNNVTVKTENVTSDTVTLTVSAADQTGPKVILINLNSTTIDVANLKYLHVMYDGHSIIPATNVDEILHTTSSDEPYYAILITQSGAQILVSIPHFSTHTIMLSSISKVIQPVPEFPLSAIAVFASIIAITIVITRKRIALRY